MENEESMELKGNLLKGIISSVVAAFILGISHLPYLPTLLFDKIGFIYRYVERMADYNYYVIISWHLLVNCFVGVLLGIVIGLLCFLIKLKVKYFNGLILTGFALGLVFGYWDTHYLRFFCGNSTFQEIVDFKIRHILSYGASFGIYAMLLGAAFKR